ncbi:arginine--tRNA ligase [Candidatus Woesearchaeota archaeon]|nr:arginine--tRNA ligase [Candidatus Woesearchaeota archaeon]
MDYAEEIIKILKTHMLEDIEIKLEVPPDKNLGDFAFPCFLRAKSWKKSPQLIAHDLAAKLNGQHNNIIEKVVAAGPYVNFFLHKKNMAVHILSKIYEQSENEKFGSQKQEQKIMIEFSSPNTNKPLHLGHVRNISLGDSMSRIFSFLGNYVVKVC